MIGVGVGVGFGGVGLSPAWLVSRLVQRHGANLVSLHLADDLSGSDIVARVGLNATRSGAGTIAQGLYNSRKCIVTASDAGRQLDIADGLGAKSYWAVAEGFTVSGYQVLAHNTNPSFSLFVAYEAGTQLWASNSGYVHIVDGTVSHAIPTSGMHVFEATHVTALVGAFLLGRTAGGAALNYPANWCLFMRLAEQPSARDRAATLADLQRYYRI